MGKEAGLDSKTIPFCAPYMTGREVDYVKQSIESRHLQGDGPFTQKCTQKLQSINHCHNFLTPSGTHALELALMSLGLEKGDEVILPSYTFVSTANAVVQLGLQPVFIDIRPDTLNIDENLIEQAITPKTKAIMVVHYAGVGCEMDAINAIAKQKGLYVVEDAAHAIGASYQGKPLGGLADIGIYSFHQTKNLTTGEGGAIAVKNKDLLNAAQIHREKGTNRTQFLDGEVDFYTWIDKGSSYLLSDILAAFLYAQLEEIETINNKRKQIYSVYQENLAQHEELTLPTIPPSCQSNYHLFHFLCPNEKMRDGLLAHLKEHHIMATTHFVPLHSSPGGKKFGITRGPMAVTDKTAKTLLRLPLYPDLSKPEMARILDAISQYLNLEKE